MPILTPNKIYKDFKGNKLRKNQASELLISLIEDTHQNDYKTQIQCLKLLGLVASKEEDVFNFLENLLISDLNEQIRGIAASIIINNFPNRARKPIMWALKHEKSTLSLTIIIKALEKHSNPKLKSLLNVKKCVSFEGNIYFPAGFYPIINLNGKNVEEITNIYRLGQLKNLRKLYLNYNQIKEINGLENLSELRSLHLQSNRINKISGLNHFKKLEFLYINNNEISKIDGLDNVSNLKLLQLFDNDISEIQGLEKLQNLEILNLRNNEIREIKGLNLLSNLKRLDLSNNQIIEIKGLDKLTKLEFLDLSYNEINEIKSLAQLKKLKFLDLRHNRITGIKGLEKLKKLQHLYIGFNKIEQYNNIEILNHVKILDIKNTEGSNILDSLWSVYKTKEKEEDLVYRKLIGFKDVILLPGSFKSLSLFKELKLMENPIEFFTDSLWAITWKTNEVETFRLSKIGKITWIQKSKHRKVENSIDYFKGVE